MKKIALVTGASSGIGKSAVKALESKGFVVYAAARRVEKMADLASENVHLISMDITNTVSIEKGVQNILGRYNRIDVLVNNAGYGLFGTVEDIPLSEARYQFEVNFFGLTKLVQLVLPSMRKNKEGKIINISSIGGKIYTPYGAYYHATKHALEGYSDCLRYELKPFNINVVLIEPGIIQSEWSNIAKENMEKHSLSGSYSDGVAFYSKYLEKVYSKRSASKPEIIGNLIAKVSVKKNPSPRYAAGKMAHLSLITRKFLPDNLFDYVLKKQISIISKLN